jgi:hypothetical protein
MNHTEESILSVTSPSACPVAPRVHNTEEVHGTAHTGLPNTMQTVPKQDAAVESITMDVSIRDGNMPTEQLHSSNAMSRIRTSNGSTTPSAGTHQMSESKLNTPVISRELYLATHVQNGIIPASGGLSPTKQSPQSSFTSNSTGPTGTTPIRIPPGITLSPTPHKTIMTPPTKPQEHSRPHSQQ